MKALISIISLCVLVTACATGGRMGDLPQLDPAAPAGKVVVIRESNFIGGALAYYVLVDEKEIFSILSGQYTEFQMAPGEYDLATRMFGGWSPTWKENVVHLELKPSETRYLFIWPKANSAGIKEIDSGAAEGYLAKYKFVKY